MFAIQNNVDIQRISLDWFQPIQLLEYDVRLDNTKNKIEVESFK